MTDNSKPTKAGAIRKRNMRKILDAAEYEFVQHGYKGTSTQAVADKAGLPKANILYYFKSKEKLYIAVLQEILELWTEIFGEIREEDDPAEQLERFIRAKIEMSFRQPRASKLFAMEIIQGAPHIEHYLETNMRTWLREKTFVIHRWIELGKMDAVDPMHFIFMLWASTQHYADFDKQVLTLMERKAFKSADREHIARSLSEILLKGCGLVPSHLKESS